jgi:heme exporter protein B
MKAFGAVFLRDLRLAARAGGGPLTGLLFFLTVVAMLPFAIGPDLALLRRIGPAILWFGALLSSLLSLDRIFALDQDDGSLDLILMGRAPLELTVVAKAAAHWLAAELPLVAATPLLGLLLDLPPRALFAVAATLLVGTPAITLIGVIGAALSVSLRHGGLLLAVTVLPLTVPVLIFGVAASTEAVAGTLPFGPPFLMICAFSLASIVIAPVAAAVALRHGVD